MGQMYGVVAGLFVVLTAPGERAEAQSWIEYEIAGSATHAGRDEDVVLCATTEDGLQARALGDWTFAAEAPSAEAGTHEARFMVSAPEDVAALHDDDFRTDDQLRGEGTIAIEIVGTEMGMPLITVRFTAKGLTSDTGATIDIEGTFHCMAM